MRHSPGVLVLLLIIAGAATALHGSPASPGAHAASPLPSASPGAQVGTISAIDGTVSVQRAGEPRWYDGYVQMPDYVRDRLRTDDRSMAAIDLATGGRLGINRGTEVELTTEGGTPASGASQGGSHTLVLTSGTVWAKFEKQEKPVQIQTSSALLTIKGTEFTVEAAADDTTTLSVLEGEVAYAPLGLESPVPATLAGAGTQVTLPLRKRAIARRVGAASLRQQLEKRHPQLNQWYVRRIMVRRMRYAEYQLRSAQVVRNPNRLRGRGLPPDDPRRNRFRRPGTSPSASPTSATGPADHPTSLAPDEQQTPLEELAFRWAPVGRCAEYAVVVSRDEDFSSVDWSARVRGTSIAYPKNGFPLQHGQRYYWRVVGIDAEGVPQSKASQTFFTVAP